jgi:DNA-binding GntR family transcriptional regulator
VAHAVANPTPAWRAAVRAASAELLARWSADPHDARASGTAYRSFYADLTSTCSSSRLRHYAAAVRDQDARYRMATIDTVDRTRLAKGHRRLVRSALAGDAASAGDAVRTEIEQFAAAYRTIAGGA